VRCLEIALQEQYQAVEQRETDTDLAGLIHWAEGHLAARAALFQRFAALRQLAHRHRSVDEHELLTPLTTIRDVTALLNEFFPLPAETIPQRLDCPLCGGTHTHPISRRAYYLGNIVSLQCERSRIARPWMIDWI
jgi:signal transduction histidine kinase